MSNFLEELPKSIRVIIAGGLVLLILVIMISLFSGGGSSEPQDNDPNFELVAAQHFADIQKAWNEDGEVLEITCHENSCRNGVVYFDFTELPEDLELAIRTNTATFSKLKEDSTGTSHVDIIARLNGTVIFECAAKNGVVTECR